MGDDRSGFSCGSTVVADDEIEPFAVGARDDGVRSMLTGSRDWEDVFSPVKYAIILAAGESVHAALSAAIDRHVEAAVCPA